MLVHLRLEDAELIELSLVFHAQAAVAVGAVLQSNPEVGILVYHLGVVAYGAPQVAGPVQQGGAVVGGHEVVGLHLEHVVEVVNGPVVVAHLYTEQSAVVVSQEVIGVEVDGGVIVGHGSAQVVAVEACQRAVHIVAHHLGFQVDGLGELLVRPLPVFSREADVGPCHP